MNDHVFVYVIQEPDSDFVKIGVAAHPERRVRELQIGNPRALMLTYLAKFSNRTIAGQVEFRVHVTLAKYRCCGEWFGCGVEVAGAAVVAAARYVKYRRGNVSRYVKTTTRSLAAAA